MEITTKLSATRKTTGDDKAHYLYGIKPVDKVLLIEDEVTSGRGLAGLASTLREHQVEITAMCSIIETVNFGGRELIKSETGIELVSLVQAELGSA